MILFITKIFILDNELTLDESNLVVNFYETENKQYILDSDITTLEKQLDKEYGNQSEWFEDFTLSLKSVINNQKNGNKMKTAVHIGASTGRISFELAKLFENVSAQVVIKYMSISI